MLFYGRNKKRREEGYQEYILKDIQMKTELIHESDIARGIELGKITAVQSGYRLDLDGGKYYKM